jgi:hypothetical protein
LAGEKRTLIKSIGIHKRFREKKFGLKEHPRGETFPRRRFGLEATPLIVRLTQTRPHQRDGFDKCLNGLLAESEVNARTLSAADGEEASHNWKIVKRIIQRRASFFFLSARANTERRFLNAADD